MTRWWVGVTTRVLPSQRVVTAVAGWMRSPATTAWWSMAWLKEMRMTSSGRTSAWPSTAALKATTWTWSIGV